MKCYTSIDSNTKKSILFYEVQKYNNKQYKRYTAGIFSF